MDKLPVDSKVIQAIQSGLHRTLEISKFVYGSDATKGMINPKLYKMETQGILKHVKDEWWINETDRFL
jgi:hypothetical protein